MVNGQTAACAIAAGSGAVAKARACRWWALPAALAVSIGLAACGGGGGADGGAGGGAPFSAGLLRVAVNDAFGTSVAGASVEGPLSTLQTDAQGVALMLVHGAAGDAAVTVSSPGFDDQSAFAPLRPHQNNDILVTLVRAISAAGGSLTSRGGSRPSVNGGAQEMAFAIELVAVDGNSTLRKNGHARAERDHGR